MLYFCTIFHLLSNITMRFVLSVTLSISFLHQEVMFLSTFVCLLVCVFICVCDNSKTNEQILL